MNRVPLWVPFLFAAHVAALLLLDFREIRKEKLVQLHTLDCGASGASNGPGANEGLVGGGPLFPVEIFKGFQYLGHAVKFEPLHERRYSFGGRWGSKMIGRTSSRRHFLYEIYPVVEITTQNRFQSSESL